MARTSIRPQDTPPLVTGTALPRVVFLGGMGRSGTTLLERLLGELPGVCSAGEVVHLWQRGISDAERCGCGEPLPSCPFWGEVGRVAFGGWPGVDVRRVGELRHSVDRSRHIPLLAAPVLAPPLHRALDEYTGYFLRTYAAIAAVSGSRVVVDSSKHASLAFCLRWSRELDLRVVHVVRDSRAVAFSWTRRVIRPESASDPYMPTYSPPRAALLWNAQNSALQVLALEGVPTLRIRYEDLVSAPRPALVKIARFAGIGAVSAGIGASGAGTGASGAGTGASGADLGFLGGGPAGRWAVLGTAHTASGNPMRFVTGKIPIHPDDRWRAEMLPAHRRMVTALTLPLLARYGYTSARHDRPAGEAGPR